MSGMFEGERAVVVGAGVAGSACALALLQEGASVLVTELRPESEISGAEELRTAGATVVAGGHLPEHLDASTLVVSAPGVPESADVLGWARDRGIPVWGEMELGARMCAVPYIAVTGTNGKTTTTGMIEACLRAGGIDALACGNIGLPFVTAARQGHQALVVECSSFQLQTQVSLHPKVSVLLNLASDHLDWHGSYQAYVAAKAKVFAGQAQGDTHVGNRDDAQASALSDAAPCNKVWFTGGAPAQGEIGYEGGRLVSRLGRQTDDLGPVDPKRAGIREDAAAAAAASLKFGADPVAVAQGLAAFVPGHHRGELVATVEGVRFIDNSKATNVHAALAAIDSLPGAVLIAGGRAKGVDLSPLRTRADRLVAVVGIGESAQELVRVFNGSIPVHVSGSIEDAVRVAFRASSSGGTVLLAPACASWDQFRDYEERGERFAAAAASLAKEPVTRG